MPTVKVKGMSCQHCVKAVTEAMEKLGAKDVSIDLLSGDVTYGEDGPVNKDAIKEALAGIGFEYAG